MRFSSLLASSSLAALLLALHPVAQAQQNGKPAAANADGSLSTAPAATPLPPRLRPLFGGLNVAQATQLLGANRLDDVAKSFASRAEASAFFSQKGYEYLNENKPDTATYRFNLAWLLNPQNPDAYHGLGIIASREPGSASEAMGLLSQALVLAPTNGGVLTDLGSLYLIRYGQTKKKKDLTTATGYLQRAIAAEPTNATAWQDMARVYYYQEKYPAAWEAVHKGQTLNMSSIDFDFIPELIAKQPDPQGIFK
jgi:Tfp pilus assembly protein PilF